jgi:hypothetical protein
MAQEHRVTENPARIVNPTPNVFLDTIWRRLAKLRNLLRKVPGYGAEGGRRLRRSC